MVRSPAGEGPPPEPTLSQATALVIVVCGEEDAGCGNPTADLGLVPEIELHEDGCAVVRALSFRDPERARDGGMRAPGGDRLEHVVLPRRQPPHPGSRDLGL